jgi:hypothetical protein
VSVVEFPGLGVMPLRRVDAAALARVADELRAIQGGNWVHAAVYHRDGSIDDLGISPNLRTDDGDDWQAGQMGGLLGNSTGSPFTGTPGATSATVTGTPLTTNALKGRRVRTGADVYGNVGSNTTSVITVDQWWTVADGVATTPGAVAFTVDPGYAPARFVALTRTPARRPSPTRRSPARSPPAAARGRWGPTPTPPAR